MTYGERQFLLDKYERQIKYINTRMKLYKHDMIAVEVDIQVLQNMGCDTAAKERAKAGIEAKVAATDKVYKDILEKREQLRRDMKRENER